MNQREQSEKNSTKSELKTLLKIEENIENYFSLPQISNNIFQELSYFQKLAPTQIKMVKI